MDQNLATLDLKNITTYEDFLSSYIQLEETSAQFSWMKADLLDRLAKNFGEKSLVALSKDIKQPRSTIINYVRVARAFPEDKRLANASFTLHFQASFADSYDPQKGEFLTNTRFDWLNQAVDEGWSTRRLAENIQEKRLDSNLDTAPSILEGKQLVKELIFLINNLEKDLPKSYEAIKLLYNFLKKNPQ